MNYLPLVVIAIAALVTIGLSLRRSGPSTSAADRFEPLPARRKAVSPPSDSAVEMLQRMAEGVLVLGPDTRPTFANRAARSLLGLEADTLPPRLPSQEIVENARRAGERGTESEEEIEIYFPRRMTLRVQASPLPREDSVMVVLLDVTEERKTQRIRREFVAHASHELKSPVASLQALAEAVTQALPDDMEAAERFSERLVAEADRLAKLIGDLLDLSRLENPTYLPDEPCDLAEVVRREVAHSEAAAHEAGLSFISNVAKRLMMRGDPQQLNLLVRNLVENAIQYTPAGGHVWISARRSSEGIQLEVADDGPGIPLEARERVFERFYRLDKGRSRDRGGTGLGLAIVKHVAELHSGTLQLDSELGEGSRFSVTFPAAEEPAQMDMTPPKKESA